MADDPQPDRPFGSRGDEETLTSAIPSRERQEDDGPMPDGSPSSELEAYERAQVPTQRSDITDTDR